MREATDIEASRTHERNETASETLGSSHPSDRQEREITVDPTTGLGADAPEQNDQVGKKCDNRHDAPLPRDRGPRPAMLLSRTACSSIASCLPVELRAFVPGDGMARDCPRDRPAVGGSPEIYGGMIASAASERGRPVEG